MRGFKMITVFDSDTQEKLDNIDTQIEKTDELIDKQEEYLDAISQNLPIDKNIMTAYYNDVIDGLAM